jgi:hypothetical protein
MWKVNIFEKKTWDSFYCFFSILHAKALKIVSIYIFLFFSHPATKCKTNLAENITATFPQMRQNVNPNVPSYCMFFHRATNKYGKTVNRGKIEVKCAKLASKMPGRQRRLSIKPKMLEFAAANVDIVSI